MITHAKAPWLIINRSSAIKLRLGMLDGRITPLFLASFLFLLCSLYSPFSFADTDSRSPDQISLPAGPGAAGSVLSTNTLRMESPIQNATTSLINLGIGHAIEGSNKVIISGVETALPSTATLGHVGWDGSAPSPGAPAIGADKFAEAYSAALQRNDFIGLLQGSWQGTLEEQNEYKEETSFSCWDAVMAYHIDLLLNIGGGKAKFRLYDSRHTFHATGTLQYKDPIVTSQPNCPDPGDTIKFVRNTGPVLVEVDGGIAEATQEMHFNDWKGIPANPFKVTLGKYDSIPYEEMNPIVTYARINRITPDHLSLIIDFNFRPGLTSPGGMHHIQGEFSRPGTASGAGDPLAPKVPPMPKRWLAALLAYLLLILAGIFRDPAASKFVAGFGGLVGLTEALRGLGLEKIAQQGRLGGFVGAALAEAVELARIYQTSTEAGETTPTTAARLGISFGADLVGFVAGAAIMEAAVGVVATAAGIAGTAGAVIVGVGGAALLTYGVAAGVDAAKSWANNLLGKSIGK